MKCRGPSFLKWREGLAHGAVCPGGCPGGARGVRPLGGGGGVPRGSRNLRGLFTRRMSGDFYIPRFEKENPPFSAGCLCRRQEGG